MRFIENKPYLMEKEMFNFKKVKCFDYLDYLIIKINHIDH